MLGIAWHKTGYPIGMTTIEDRIEELAKDTTLDILGIWESENKVTRKLRDIEAVISQSLHILLQETKAERKE